MKIIGITGNTGSGKSAAAKALAGMGGFVIDADKLAHEVILRGQAAYDEIVAYFGESILTNNEIDRKKLGQIVFADKTKLDALTKITHKYIIKRTTELIDSVTKQPDTARFIVIDAPLLYEAGMDRMCDSVVIIYASDAVRRKRIIARDNITPEMADKRMAAQKDVRVHASEKTFLIENDATVERLVERVEQCFMPLI